MSRRGLDQERTAVHCDLFNVLPMLMHGAQPPSLVSDKTNTWRGALGSRCVLFFPDSPPLRSLAWTFRTWGRIAHTYLGNTCWYVLLRGGSASTS